MTIADVYSALWRQKLFIVTMTAAIVGLTWFLTSREQPMYTSSTLVRIQQQINNPTEAFGALQTGGRLAQTYARIAGTGRIAARVYEDLGQRIPFSAIAGSISGSQVADLELLSIDATSRNPRWAQLIANATPGALRSFISETGTAHDQVITVEPAWLPRSPSSPNTKLNVTIALVLGLIFNGALALLIDLLRDRARGPAEFEQLAGKPVLATVPNLPLSRASRLLGGEMAGLVRLRPRRMRDG
jgi:capsular polysaccharide biosynthesis protein